MSYDLSFERTDASRISDAAFHSYFVGRRWYTVEGAQAAYTNKDTGVYFSFLFGEQSTFNINFNRPSFFGLEAAPELSAFVDHFKLIVDDPQTDGMGRGPFSADRFLDGWNRGNRWAASGIRDQVRTYPRDRLLSIWRWNYDRQALQQKLGGEPPFVPKISFAAYRGKVLSYCVWPDAVPAWLPTVDCVMIVRDQLSSKQQMEYCLAPWNMIDGKLKTFARSNGVIHLDYQDAPQSVIQTVKWGWVEPSQDEFKALNPDAVLDAEMFSA